MKIRFEPSGYECDVAAGTRIVDLTDDHPDADVPYSCRSASCGTCRIEIIEGADALSEPEEDEREVIDLFGDNEKTRLACQTKIVGQAERIVVRVIDPY